MSDQLAPIGHEPWCANDLVCDCGADARAARQATEPRPPAPASSPAVEEMALRELKQAEHEMRAVADDWAGRREHLLRWAGACREALKLAFPDLTWKARAEELIAQLAALQQAQALYENAQCITCGKHLDEDDPPAQHLEDSLHDVFTRHGIASRSDLPDRLIGDLICWAAQKCRETRPPSPEALRERLTQIIQRERRFQERQSWRQATSEALIDELEALLSLSQGTPAPEPKP